MDAEYDDPRPLAAAGRSVSPFERNMPDRPRYSDDGWRTIELDDGITLEVVVEHWPLQP
jgi:hypothetical protein